MTQQIRKASAIVWLCAGLIILLNVLIYTFRGGVESADCQFKVFKDGMNKKGYQLLVVTPTDTIIRLKVK